MEKTNLFAVQDSNEEQEDTLSLSDLPMYHDSQNIDFWAEDQSARFDIEQDFEFSSEMMLASYDSSNPIVFCGKIIHVSPQINTIQKFESKKERRRCKHPGTSLVALHKWRFTSFFNWSSFSEPNIHLQRHDTKHEMPINKASIMASTTKPRWYLFKFSFGSRRFPQEMHVRDLKKRQTSIQSKRKDFDTYDSGGEDVDGMESPGLIRFLGCTGGRRPRAGRHQMSSR